MSTLEFKKCIGCIYAVWPVTRPGFCSAHNMRTDEAREKDGPCGWDATSHVEKPEQKDATQ